MQIQARHYYYNEAQNLNQEMYDAPKQVEERQLVLPVVIHSALGLFSV